MAQNYVLLERIELNATVSSVSFNNIPQTGYTDLKVDMSVRGTTAQIYTLMDIFFKNRIIFIYFHPVGWLTYNI